MYRFIFAILIFTLTLITACSSDSNAEEEVINEPVITYSLIASGNETETGLSDNRKIEIFRTQESFTESIYRYIQFIQDPGLDFSSQQVVLLSLGFRTSGYTIQTDAVEEFDEYIKLKILITSPGENCYLPQV